MSTYEIGRRATANIVAELVNQGYDVYVPIGEGGEIDLVIERDGVLQSVQCKSANLVGGTVNCRFYSVAPSGKSRYNKIDLFAYWCAENEVAYFIRKDEATDTAMRLRVSNTKNGQSSGVRWAADYLCA